MFKTAATLFLTSSLAALPLGAAFSQCCKPQGGPHGSCGQEVGPHPSALSPVEPAPAAVPESGSPSKTKSKEKESAKVEAGFLKPYFSIWRDLAKDQVAGVAEARKHLISSLDAMLKAPPAGLGAKGRVLRAKLLTAARREAQGLEVGDVKKARAGFGRLSAELVNLVEKLPQEGDAYVLYCDMAKKGWLQDSARVLNPYYGASMLACGRVTHEPKQPSRNAKAEREDKPEEKKPGDAHKGHDHP